MLGHKLYQYLCKYHNCYATTREFGNKLVKTNLYDVSKIINNIDVFSFNILTDTISLINPEIIINCIGIIKQKDNANNFKKVIYINSYLTHLLAEYCDIQKIKLIQISTDCVFDGFKGNYKEDDVSNALDLYGKSKFLGELNFGNSLTIRTSIIGHELFTNYSLVDWFLSQNGKVVHGFVNAIYTGFPTIIFVKIISEILIKYPELRGLVHVSSEKINKYDLLSLIKKIYHLNVEIEKDTSFSCDRSLDSSLFKSITKIILPDWEEMINRMFTDFKETKYEIWKNYSLIR